MCAASKKRTRQDHAVFSPASLAAVSKLHRFYPCASTIAPSNRMNRMLLVCCDVNTTNFVSPETSSFYLQPAMTQYPNQKTLQSWVWTQKSRSPAYVLRLHPSSWLQNVSALVLCRARSFHCAYYTTRLRCDIKATHFVLLNAVSYDPYRTGLGTQYWHALIVMSASPKTFETLANVLARPSARWTDLRKRTLRRHE